MVSAKLLLKHHPVALVFAILLATNVFLSISFQHPESFHDEFLSDQDWELFRFDYKHRYDREPPVSLKQWLHYANNLQCETRNFYDGIDRDLKIFRQNKSFSLVPLDNVIEEVEKFSFNHVSFSLENNTLKVENWAYPSIWNVTMWTRIERIYIEYALRWLLKPLIEHQPPIRSKFVFNLHDIPTYNETAKAPVFSVCDVDFFTDNQQYSEFENRRSEAEHDDTRPLGNYNQNGEPVTKDLLVPYYYSIGFLARGLWFWPFYNLGKRWRERKNAVTWRGSTTGLWMEGPRFDLVRKYGGGGVHPLNPNLTTVDADIGFTSVVQNNGQPLGKEFRMARKMSYHDIQQHKYVIDVDGNAFTSRFPGLLRSRTLVFKTSKYREWFSERIQPWMDYIPVNYDLSDLASKVAWADAHPELVEQIVEHSRKTVERYLRPDEMRCYTYRLMLEYQALF